MSQQSDNANNFAATSASQPSASSCSAGATGSDVGAAQPGIVKEVLEFGRIPREIKRPITEEEQKEVKLAKRYRKKRKIFLTWTAKNLPRSQNQE